jgi:16S rRNA (cytidine1402-2'-O)-methyltransferase
MNAVIDSTDRQAVQPGLYLVSTPIGNLRDITLRALDVLGGADAVICEDTRVTGKLLAAYNLKKTMLVYNDHSDEGDRAGILRRLDDGQSLALVTDAGTPLVSDPGFKLVHAALARGIAVIPIPGASALLPALQMAGLPCDKFLFAGFLPPKSAARKTALAALKDVPATLVFYESPARLVETLADALDVLGDRPAAMAREITKLHEEARHGTLSAWAADESLLGTLKGEAVLMIGPPVHEAATEDDIRASLRRAMATLSVKDAAAHVAAATGAPKKRVYDLALRLKDGQ